MSDWKDRPRVRTLGQLPHDGGKEAFMIGLFCEGLDCENPYRFYAPEKPPPLPLDFDIQSAFEAGRFRCRQCGGKAVSMTIWRALDGNSPERFMKLHNPAAAARQAERFEPIRQARLAALRRDYGWG